MPSIVAKLRAHYQQLLLLVLALMVVLFVYWRDLEIIASEALRNEAFNYVLLIPFFVGMLFYLKIEPVKADFALQKQQRHTRTRYLDELVGIAFCLIAFLLYWYGSYTIYPLECHLLTLPIFTIGMTLIVSGLRVLRILVVPILFLFFLIPLPAEALKTAGSALANVNTQAAHAVLRALGLPVTLSLTYGPPIIQLTTAAGQAASFTVDIACSGLYSLIAFTMLGTFLALIVSASPLKKAVMFAFGFIVFDILNVTRLVAIVSIGYELGQETAMFLFHSIAGLLFIFAGMLFTLFAAERLFKIRVLPKLPPAPSCPNCGTSKKRLISFCFNCGKFLNPSIKRVSQELWAKLLILFLGCSIITISINAPAFAITLGPKGTPLGYGWQNATDVFPPMSSHHLTFLLRDTVYEKIANQYLSLIYGYYPLNASDRLIYVYLAVADTPSNLHNWEDCLISYQIAQGRSPLVNQLDRRDAVILPDVPITAQYLVFENRQTNYTQITLYWYEKATFNTGITVEQKYVRISLLTITENSKEYPQLEDELFTMGQEIARFWEPLKNQSLASLGIPTIQILLASSVVFIALTETGQHLNEQRKKNINTRLFGSYASRKEKIALQTIRELSREKRNVETRDIRSAITQKTGKQVKLSTLLKVLNRLEEHGFIRKNIAHFNDTPILSWKA